MTEDKQPVTENGCDSNMGAAMTQKTDCKKISGGINDRDMAENIQTQLEEARFISSFMAAVCTSLEINDICSIAARALYVHAPYYRVVFAFSADLEEKTVTFSPMSQKGILATRHKNAADSYCSLTALDENSLASAHLTLLDNLGTIAIYFKSGQYTTLSESLRASVAACFSQAIRNAQEHGRIKDLAMRDGLTDLFNRRVFDETLAQKVKNPDMRPVSLLLIDLDNFKLVNDTFGHQAGDQVLKTLARILKDSCRGHDLVARFGGEEFAIILSQTQAATAHAIAQRIRNRLAKTSFTFDNRQLQVTASIGLATCPEASSIFTSNLVKRADRALYQAKRTGKNKVCVLPADLLTGAIHSLGDENFASAVPASC
jgi:two-component system, cell cycle response regulator